ncbi:MAG: hypothetical protein K8U57_12150 [Planctomycetes bacterium]|nr:hypothetical protein [Planctomycetota bacterium]
MKRTATTLALLAGFGGGCVAPGGSASKEPTGGFGTVSKPQAVKGYQGPNGEPVTAVRGAMPDTPVQQAAMFRKYTPGPQLDPNSRAQIPGTVNTAAWNAASANGVRQVNFMAGAGCGPGCAPGGGYGGPPQGGPPNGVYPVPGMGPPGAVAAVGAMVGPGGPTGATPNGRASVKFTSPAGMKVTWQLPNGGFNDEATGLTTPKEYNFLQGQVYRLRLTQILPNHPGKAFYPTLEVSSGNPKTVSFLAHACVPITFTNDDFDHAVSGNLVVKVIYLPDRDNQDFLALGGGLEEVNSTRLEPGVDPVAEAQRKGSVLAIIRLGNIDLENRVSPVMTAPPPGGPIMLGPPTAGGGGEMGAYPPGMSSVGNAPLLPLAPGNGPGPRPLPPSAPPALLPPVK